MSASIWSFKVNPTIAAGIALIARSPMYFLAKLSWGLVTPLHNMRMSLRNTMIVLKAVAKCTRTLNVMSSLLMPRSSEKSVR